MKNVLKEKSYLFALAIVKLSRSIIQSKNEFTLSRQLMSSGTSVGALMREAEFAQSKKDFINKLSIALKEANETLYWLDLLKDSDIINENEFQYLYELNKELISILVTSIKTAKSNLETK